MKVLLGQMVRAGQVANPFYGKYALPSANPFSTYSANSEGNDEDASKEGKRSKGRDDSRSSITCIHGYPAGEGCYSCGPQHPIKKGGTS